MWWNFWTTGERKSSTEMTRPSHLVLGEKGEQIALEYLKGLGYRIALTNLIVPVGYSLTRRKVTGEIDIVAYDETYLPFTLVFIEVKTRTRSDIATPEAAVNTRKQRQIVRAARQYRRMMLIENEPYRYDVVSVIISRDFEPECTLLRNYFTEQRFMRSNWYLQNF